MQKRIIDKNYILVLLYAFLGLFFRLGNMYGTIDLIKFEFHTDIAQFYNASMWLIGEGSFESYASLPREIGWGFAVSLFFLFFSPNVITMRLASSLFGFFNIFLIYRVSYVFSKDFLEDDSKRKLVSHFSSLILATSLNVIYSDSSGVREAFLTFLILLWLLQFKKCDKSEKTTDRVKSKKKISEQELANLREDSQREIIQREETNLLNTKNLSSILPLFLLTLILIFTRFDLIFFFPFVAMAPLLQYIQKLDRNKLDLFVLIIFSLIIGFLLFCLYNYILFDNINPLMDILAEMYYRMEFNSTNYPSDLTTFTYLFKYHTIFELIFFMTSGAVGLIKLYIRHFDIFLGSLILVSISFFLYKKNYVLPLIFSFSISWYAIWAELWEYSGYERLMAPFFPVVMIMISIFVISFVKKANITIFNKKSINISETILSLLIICTVITYSLLVILLNMKFF